MRWCVLAACAVVLSACTAEFGGLSGPLSLGPADEPADPDGREACGNFADDDGDGDVDEGCACDAGTVRDCYAGPVGTLGVGVCRAGTMSCDEHFEFPAWGSCVGAVEPSVEIPDNGLDDDCDGVVDAPPADDAVCPDGMVETYHPRHPGDAWGGSGIEHGDGGASMDVTCEDAGCAPGEVAVEELGWDWGDAGDGFGDGFDDWTEPSPKSEFLCVPPPPECPEGTYPSYRSPVDYWGDAGGFDDRGDYGLPEVDSGWRCDPPCDIVVHYGALYGGLTVCTDEPSLVCPGGQVPTFVFETESWQCQPTCDNGLYDQIWLDGALLCVPC